MCSIPHWWIAEGEGLWREPARSLLAWLGFNKPCVQMQTLETFAKEVESKKEMLAAFQTKYKIRVKVGSRTGNGGILECA